MHIESRRNRHGKVLCDIIRDNPSITTGELYDAYTGRVEDGQAHPFRDEEDAWTKRHVRNILKQLVQRDILHCEQHNRGRYGRTLRYYPGDIPSKFQVFENKVEGTPPTKSEILSAGKQ